MSKTPSEGTPKATTTPHPTIRYESGSEELRLTVADRIAAAAAILRVEGVLSSNRNPSSNIIPLPNDALPPYNSEDAFGPCPGADRPVDLVSPATPATTNTGKCAACEENPPEPCPTENGTPFAEQTRILSEGYPGSPGPTAATQRKIMTFIKFLAGDSIDRYMRRLQAALGPRAATAEPLTAIEFTPEYLAAFKINPSHFDKKYPTAVEADRRDDHGYPNLSIILDRDAVNLFKTIKPK